MSSLFLYCCAVVVVDFLYLLGAAAGWRYTPPRTTLRPPQPIKHKRGWGHGMCGGGRRLRRSTASGVCRRRRRRRRRSRAPAAPAVVGAAARLQVKSSGAHGSAARRRTQRRRRRSRAFRKGYRFFLTVVLFRVLVHFHRFSAIFIASPTVPSGTPSLDLGTPGDHLP